LTAQCVASKLAFKHGEKIHYEVSYNWGVVWVDAGEVWFNTDTLTKDGSTYYFIDSYGQSYKFYNWFYKVNDSFQSEVRVENFLPKWFVRKTSEGGYEVNNRYDYNWDSNTLISATSNSKKPLSIDTLDLLPCSYDVLSAIYYARNLDFEKLTPGEKVPIRFIIDGEFYELFIRYLGKEPKKNRDGKVYDCIKFSALLVEGTIFKGGEDLIVWVTADENKIPIMVEAKILIGSVKAYLTGYENTLSDPQVLD